jgi:hypothetical protein
MFFGGAGSGPSDFISDPLNRSSLPDLPSIGKDLNKMHQQSFYNPNASITGHGIHPDVIGSAGAPSSGVGGGLHL